MVARKQSSSKNPPSRALSDSPDRPAAAARLWTFAAALLGTLLVWAALAPQDATSVFAGAALPQNLMALGLAVCVAVAVAKGGGAYAFSRSAWALAGGCVLWICVVSALAGQENNPRTAWNGFWQLVSLGGCYFAARGLVAGPQSRRSAVLILLVSCVALACQGLHQVWVEFPADRARYLADPDGVIARVPGLDAPEGSPARQRFEDRLLHSSEPYGSFALANSLAVVLSGGLVLLIGLGSGGLRRAQARVDAIGASPLIAFAVAAGVLLLCWFLTRSRVAYPALLVGGAYWVMASRLRARELRRVLLWGVGIGGLALTVAAVWLIKNDSLVLSEAPKSLSYRLEYWLATLDMLRDHWLFGIGLGNFQSYYPIYKLPLASETIADPHNWLLDIAVSLSLPLGLVVVAWLLRRLWPGTPPQSDLAHAPPGNATEVGANSLDAAAGRGLLWGAGVGGALCAMLLSLLDGMNLWPLLISWLPATIVVGLLRPVVNCSSGHFEVTARAAAVTMLTCLLVSGSWQASGIAVPLLLLLVLGEKRQIASRKESKLEHVSSEWRSWSVVLLPAVGLLLFLFQSWQPTTASWSLMQQAMVAPSPQQQLELTTAAAAADPLNSEPLRWRAELLTAEAEQAPQLLFPEAAQAALAADEAWLAMDSKKSLNWEAAGKHALQIAARAKNLGLEHENYVTQAQHYYGQGLVRYPSNIALRAQLAATLVLNQNWAEADRELRIAEELNKRTPHLDKKLQSQRLWLPLLPAGAEAEFRGEQPWVAAEPLVDWLRKTISANH